MVEKRVVVNLQTGLHARPAALFVQEANKYTSEIFVQKEEKKVNAKSIMIPMMLLAWPRERRSSSLQTVLMPKKRWRPSRKWSAKKRLKESWRRAGSGEKGHQLLFGDHGLD